MLLLFCGCVQDDGGVTHLDWEPDLRRHLEGSTSTPTPSSATTAVNLLPPLVKEEEEEEEEWTPPLVKEEEEEKEWTPWSDRDRLGLEEDQDSS